MSQNRSLGEGFAWEVCNTGALFDQFQILQTLSFNSFCSCSCPSLYLVLVVVSLQTTLLQTSTTDAAQQVA